MEVSKWWKQKKKDDKVVRRALPIGIGMAGDKFVSFIVAITL